MKTLCFSLAVSFLSTCATVEVRAQTQCGIFFDHDAVGNRVKRYYDCQVLDPSWTPPGATIRMASAAGSDSQFQGQSISMDGDITVFPNPTPGPFTIKLTQAPKAPLHFHWYNDQLQILSSGSMAETSFSGNISHWADGVYILCVYDGDKTYSFKIAKVASAGQ